MTNLAPKILHENKGDWVDGWVDGWMGGWMDGWMDGWVSGWMIIPISIKLCQYHL